MAVIGIDSVPDSLTMNEFVGRITLPADGDGCPMTMLATGVGASLEPQDEHAAASSRANKLRISIPTEPRSD